LINCEITAPLADTDQHQHRTSTTTHANHSTPTMMFGTIFLVFLLQYSSAFVHRVLPSHSTTLHATTTPILVVGNTDEALGSAFASCARDVLTNSITGEQTSRVPPAQPVAFFINKETSSEQQQGLSSETVASLQNALLFLGPTLDDYEQILAHSLQLLTRISNDANDKYGDPMLYTSIQFGQEVGSKAIDSLILTRDRYSFLGLNLCTASDHSWTRERADEWGNKLHALLASNPTVSSAAIAIDVETHLAFLQANSLPKARGVLGTDNDVWGIKGMIQDGLLVDNSDGLLVEYDYDYSDPFGGCDPLLRPSIGYVVPSSITSGISCPETVVDRSNDAYAAAYATLVGLGMDAVSSMCIATSIKAVYREYGQADDAGMYHPPTYTWSTIDEIVDASRGALQSVRQEDGLPRKMYREFGYQ